MKHNHFNAHGHRSEGLNSAKPGGETTDPRKAQYVKQIFNLLERRFSTGGCTGAARRSTAVTSARQRFGNRPRARWPKSYPPFIILAFLVVSGLASRADSLSGDNGKDK